MKCRFFVIIILSLSTFYLSAQNLKLLKLAKEKSKTIKSGSYKIVKKYKFFDFDFIKEDKFDVQFCEIDNTTNCIIKDLVNNKIYFFDTTEWVSVFNFKDSTLDKRIRFNPNNDLLYQCMQPFGLLKLLPNDNFLKKQLGTSLNSNSFKIYARKENDEIIKSSYTYLEIDKKLLIASKCVNYSIEFIDSVNFNIQNLEESITDIKVNLYKQNEFRNVLSKTYNSLPIKKIIFPDYLENSNSLKNDTNINFEDLKHFKEVSTKKLFELKNEKTVIFFTYLGCLPCKKMLPQFDSLYSKYKGEINIIGINLIDTNANRIQIYKNANNIKFDYYYNESISINNSVLKKMPISGYPSVFILDQKGKIELIIEGYIDNLVNHVEKYINN
jgi:thiol-disulfide isomerase/thioredoxin